MKAKPYPCSVCWCLVNLRFGAAPSFFNVLLSLFAFDVVAFPNYFQLSGMHFKFSSRSLSCHQYMRVRIAIKLDKPGSKAIHLNRLNAMLSLVNFHICSILLVHLKSYLFKMVAM